MSPLTTGEGQAREDDVGAGGDGEDAGVGGPVAVDRRALGPRDRRSSCPPRSSAARAADQGDRPGQCGIEGDRAPPPGSELAKAIASRSDVPVPSLVSIPPLSSSTRVMTTRCSPRLERTHVDLAAPSCVRAASLVGGPHGNEGPVPASMAGLPASRTMV